MYVFVLNARKIGKQPPLKLKSARRGRGRNEFAGDGITASISRFTERSQGSIGTVSCEGITIQNYTIIHNPDFNLSGGCFLFV